MKKLIFTLISILSVSHASADVLIYKQWHLSPKQNTTNIETSIKLPQYTNQESIYLAAKKLIQEKKSSVVISEGCEGEITANFKENFNGWNYSLLSLKKTAPEFDKILTLIPLKLEVLFGENLLTLCGDNKKLIQEHQLILSDLRAYYGYVGRLKEFKGKDEKRYAVYAEALKAPKGTDALQFAKAKGKEALLKFKELIIKRNDSFVETASRYAEKNPIIIIGGLHAEDIQKRLEAKGIKVLTISESSYEKEEKGLFEQLEAAFN